LNDTLFFLPKAIMKIWLDALPGRAREFVRVVDEQLRRVGIESFRLGLQVSPGPGILLFDAVTQELRDGIQRLSNFGLERLLAIVERSSLLKGADVWAVLKSGASDVFAWDHSENPAAEVDARFRRWAEVDRLVLSPLVQENLIGQSRTWVETLRQIVEVAYFSDLPILITGESGTGKELVARLVHTLDQRPHKKDLVVLDCTTVVPELAGSEFFGHERGAFTNAHVGRDGAFALADEGTLFLDEVGELPPTLQAELLRVVQEKTYKRVGSNAWQRTNFRLICATNRDLLHEEAQGKFRRDFYYRIAGFMCKLPPLRDRKEDIIALARHFLKRLRSEDQVSELDESVRDYLLTRDYSGNIRDLRQLIGRIAGRHVGLGPITAGDIPEPERPERTDVPIDWCDESFDSAIRRAVAWNVGLKEIGRRAENAAVRIAVSDADGNLQHAARKLGVTDRALQMRRAANRLPIFSKGVSRDVGAQA
jgi:transcriptional regulator with GAF, ATPase, and Fis domain